MGFRPSLNENQHYLQQCAPSQYRRENVFPSVGNNLSCAICVISNIAMVTWRNQLWGIVLTTLKSLSVLHLRYLSSDALCCCCFIINFLANCPFTFKAREEGKQLHSHSIQLGVHVSTRYLFSHMTFICQILAPSSHSWITEAEVTQATPQAVITQLPGCMWVHLGVCLPWFHWLLFRKNFNLKENPSSFG